MKALSNSAIITIVYILAISCARVSSPGGGPMDEDPPVILESVPENRSVNFKSNSFEITFDEYVVLENINQVLMISPPLEDKPEILIRGKTIRMSFEEELMDSITYTFNFLDAIRDLNEKNPINNYQYVFSTGPAIDSLSITGAIYDANTLEAGEDILVILYSGLADTVPNTMGPQYICRADEDGKFRIDNIAAGEYRIFGLKDNNNNKYYDLPDETFAFIDSTLLISPYNNFIPPLPILQRPDSLIADTLLTGQLEQKIDSAAYLSDSLKYHQIPGKEISLYYFVTENKIQYLTSAMRPDPYLLIFTFALPVDSALFNITFPDIDADDKYFTEISSRSDTFKLWITDSAFYSLEKITAHLDHPETDSTGLIAMVTDTINLRYIEETKSRRSEVRVVSLRTGTNLRKRSLLPEQLPVFSFSSPMLEPDTSKIRVYLLSDTIKIRQDYKIQGDTFNLKKFTINTELLQDSLYLLITEKNAFSDIYGHVSDSAGYSFNIRNINTLGKIILNISGFRGGMIIQLIDKNENLKQEKKIRLPEDSKLIFKDLEKGDYYVKAIFDIDNNGEWTSGDYSQKRQAEPVSYYSKKITVKAGWDAEEDWKISGLRQKAKILRKTGGGNKK